MRIGPKLRLQKLNIGDLGHQGGTDLDDPPNHDADHSKALTGAPWPRDRDAIETDRGEKGEPVTMSASAGVTAPPTRVSSAARLAAVLVQPLLGRIVQRIARNHPSLFARLGAHQTTDYVIDPLELPFSLHLRPDPNALVLRAVTRDALPRAGAMIRGRFRLLLQLLDSDKDGDSAFFARDLEITGDTEAVVRLRNALDDVDGSIAEETAAIFGPPGRAVLAWLRRGYPRHSSGGV